MPTAERQKKMQNKIIEIAIKAGFADAAVIDTADIVFDPAFRPYCEENLCGRYGANYSCPPDCGTPKEMEQRISAHKKALVFRSVWNIDDFGDSGVIMSAKREHNSRAQSVIAQLKDRGYTGITVGASCCLLCSPCLITEGKPCKFPNERYSCMSAYCIYVKDLAEKCGMVYDYKKGALPLFSMFAYD